ncbi:MAG: beta-ketoacyl-[acyl-carrier-protein] synthase family protein [Planctomycetaceae bacterium]|nr:beta-ketoacyl-[acyl-carrier-protein] synthase family protein [Planctomycetaceae bacterium]
MSGVAPRVVITGFGLVSPLGNSTEALWRALSESRSGITALGSPYEFLPTKVAGQAHEFTGDIANFGDMEKTLQRTVKKGLKLMCRDIQMGVAAGQLAINHAQLSTAASDPTVKRDRIGVLFGCDHILSIPDEFVDGVKSCLDSNGKFDFSLWPEKGLPKVDPLWLLKYLPNMPACHMAIYHDLHGPNNSLTVREASSNMALTEALCTIARGGSDVMIVGGTGSRIHTSRSVHLALQEQIAVGEVNPADPEWAGKACQPFDVRRSGMVLAEGAGAMILETEAHAMARGARVLGVIVAGSSAAVADARGVPNFRRAFEIVIKSLLRQTGLAPSDIGHVNAHGLGTTSCDQQEAEAIESVLGSKVPVVAVKSYIGNLGAGGGMVEAIASLLAVQNGELFRTLNCEQRDPACRINVVSGPGVAPGRCFINLNITPQGQASAVLIGDASFC